MIRHSSADRRQMRHPRLVQAALGPLQEREVLVEHQAEVGLVGAERHVHRLRPRRRVVGRVALEEEPVEERVVRRRARSRPQHLHAGPRRRAGHVREQVVLLDVHDLVVVEAAEVDALLGLELAHALGDDGDCSVDPSGTSGAAPGSASVGMPIARPHHEDERVPDLLVGDARAEARARHAVALHRLAVPVPEPLRRVDVVDHRQHLAVQTLQVVRLAEPVDRGLPVRVDRHLDERRAPEVVEARPRRCRRARPRATRRAAPRPGRGSRRRAGPRCRPPPRSSGHVLVAQRAEALARRHLAQLAAQVPASSGGTRSAARSAHRRIPSHSGLPRCRQTFWNARSSPSSPRTTSTESRPMRCSKKSPGRATWSSAARELPHRRPEPLLLERGPVRRRVPRRRDQDRRVDLEAHDRDHARRRPSAAQSSSRIVPVPVPNWIVAPADAGGELHLERLGRLHRGVGLHRDVDHAPRPVGRDRDRPALARVVGGTRGRRPASRS